MPLRASPISWGIVQVSAGPSRGRIGTYDDDDLDGKAIVYFGDVWFLREYELIPHSQLRAVNSRALLRRREQIHFEIGFGATKVDDAQRADLLAELLLIDNALGDRFINTLMTATTRHRRVFVSYTSMDGDVARGLAVDLAAAGHYVWLDEWRIKVGESIPTKIAEGIQGCDSLAVVLSKRAVASRWVEREWQAQYVKEIADRRTRVLPILIQDCKIPSLLQMKKYADFRTDYEAGLEALLRSLATRLETDDRPHSQKRRRTKTRGR